jgi:enamine deaminase RidA (YjgF/YER057c/UK114 family)
MKLSLVNPEGLHKPVGYTHVASVEGSGKILYISGQVARNQKGDIVGVGDLETQTRQVYENLSSILKKMNATFSDVTKQNIYTTRLDQINIIRKVRDQYLSQVLKPACTLVGVTGLAEKDFLIEIEMVAAIPPP